jgi:hypothetical protein
LYALFLTFIWVRFYWQKEEHWLITYVGLVALVTFVAFLLALSEWARTERSRDRPRGILCLYVGHSLPKRSHAWTNASAPVERFSCRRCGREFETQRLCDVCRGTVNERELP